MEIEALSKAITLFRGALALLKDAKSLLPDSKEKKDAESALDHAEKAFAISEAQLAKELGYEICQCTWPPQIGLRKPDGSSRCPKCGRNIYEDYRGSDGGGCY